MRRRDLFKAAGASLAAFAAPRIGRAEKTNKLVFAPAADLSVLDPVVTGYRPTRNHAYLVFDTLYGIDTNWAPSLRWSRDIRSRRMGSSGP
jgi:peptide/nickel transport system substrate-binding protein